GRADEGKAAFIGNSEDDAPVDVLEDESVFAGIEAIDDDMTALDEAQFVAPAAAHLLRQKFAGPWPRRVHQGAGAHGRTLSLLAFELRYPGWTVAAGRNAGGAGHDLRATLARIDRIEDDKPCIVDPTVGIFEAGLKPALEGAGIGRPPKIDLARAR